MCCFQKAAESAKVGLGEHFPLWLEWKSPPKAHVFEELYPATGTILGGCIIFLRGSLAKTVVFNRGWIPLWGMHI